MKIVILTTETLHHAYFVREMAKAFPLERVLVERNTLSPPFETHHPFEDERESYEQRIFFHDKKIYLSDIAETLEVSSVNNLNSVTYLRSITPDVIVVFGAGKISKEVIQICPNGIINLHGGDPEEYRGLDSHLWAIYHRDFGSLITTLHHLNEKLDDGAIILQAAIPLKQGMQLHELRRYSTELCIDMTTSALNMFTRWGRTICRPQRKRGRYYSFMPSAMKEICQIRFKQYTDSLS